MTSGGVKQFRHKWIDLDALIFTNIAPEHIEAHGSYKKYVAAKVKLAASLEHSPKKNKVVVVNADDKHAKDFLDIAVDNKRTYALKDARPYRVTHSGITLTLDDITLHSPLLGIFNVYNILAAAVFVQSQGIPITTIKKALAKCGVLRGRVEKINAGPLDGARGKQNFTVIVDYAHTKESLKGLYQTFEKERKICVLGNTGGGRDTWKRPEMGRVADAYCTHIILTNEDPYDEDPRAIVQQMAATMQKHTPEIIMDRRTAIRKALSLASAGDVVLITGKGTDQYIMGPRGTKTPWSDAEVAKEELEHILQTQ